MKASELRKKYIAFFISKGHVEIPSASVVPQNDPTVLFTTAGMHPLVPYLLGEPHPAGKRLVDYQRCIRTGDIEDVGDNTHLTFFTMLGNWSLGDYFKQESIEWSFEFLTSPEWLGIPLTHLAFTVFQGDQQTPFDQEAFDKWLSLGIAPERIAKLGVEDNWWGPAGKTGPCGPDTEIFYWTGSEVPPANYDPSDKRWMEIWNNVFMQFNKGEDGTLVPLEKGSVDTGMGMERTTVALQRLANVYETELFTGIIEAIERVSGRVYSPKTTREQLEELEKNESGGSFSSDVSRDAQTKAFRIIADHVRTASVLIADGIEPANKDQGYILRRLIRRAVMQGRNMDLNFLTALEDIIESVIVTLEDAYPMLREQKERIISVILAEVNKFNKTLDQGLKEFKKLWEKQGSLMAKDAFDLYQSYGFPLEVTAELAQDRGQVINRNAFAEEFKQHQDLSRQGAEKKFAGGLADNSEETTRLHTATHLVHQALRMVLGNHVEQKGSNITAERLRFDFSHGEKMTPEQIADVERIVNEQINRALPVSFELMSTEEAKAAGAIGLFEDKYAQIDGGKIKVYKMGDFSMEICGGPHVANTKELGGFKIQKEEASSAGIRRIKAILG